MIDDLTPAGKELYLIADNCATHKHAKVQRWLKRHPRFHVYFTPTGAYWLDMVELFFRDLTQNRLRRGVFRDVEELTMAVEGYIDGATRIRSPSFGPPKLATSWRKVKRARKALDTAQSV
ncbi:MAG: ISBmu8 transposase [Bryobacterales bacterium]|nr:ISBmu8 transposase [Bryobacterales bacterium]